MSPNTAEQEFLQPPTEQQHEPIYRKPSTYNPLDSFRLPSGPERHYQQQYGDMYFLRLAKLKPAVEAIGAEAWEGFSNFTSAPPPRRTYHDPSNPDLAQIMLEDESGRLRLTGYKLKSTQLATGAIVAVLGTENADGDFEVIDIKAPDLPRQPSRWGRDEESRGSGKGKIALISGLAFTGTSNDNLALELLTDYLLGYTGSFSAGNDDTNEHPDASTITRLIIAGNSIGATLTINEEATGNGASANKNDNKKYGYDSTAYNASPITQLDDFLAEILPSIPITIMAGESDPANFAVPQQPIHRAMFPRARAYCSAPPSSENEKPEPGWFDSVTNPWEGDVDGWRLYGTSGQNVDDVLRYLDVVDDDANGGNASDAESRIRIMESMLRWRCAFPTAPDTIWSYPFQTDDPFVMQTCPHLFFAGNQPQFNTAIVEGEFPSKMNGDDTEMNGAEDTAPVPTVRLVSIPKFQETGELVLVDNETLEVEVVKFGTFSGQEEKQ